MLSKIHDSDCIEMEAFAFLSAARELDQLKNCIVIKWISDWADKSAHTEHEKNLAVAMQNSIVVLDNILESWK